MKLSMSYQEEEALQLESIPFQMIEQRHRNENIGKND